MKQNLLVCSTLVLVGLLLGVLGSFSLPLGHGISNFWPGIVVQVCGGIWFGAWGTVAAVLFPFFSNLLIGGGDAQVFGFIPANLLQGVIPACAFRLSRVPADLPGGGEFVYFCLFGAVVPSLAGGMAGALSLVSWGEAPAGSYWELVWAWARPNMLLTLLLGGPALKALTPIFVEYRLLVRGYWK